MFTSKCPLTFQIYEGLGPFFQIVFLKTDTKGVFFHRHPCQKERSANMLPQTTVVSYKCRWPARDCDRETSSCQATRRIKSERRREGKTLVINMIMMIVMLVIILTIVIIKIMTNNIIDINNSDDNSTNSNTNSNNSKHNSTTIHN